MREKCGGEERVNGNFGRAAHKGRKQNGHRPVALGRERPCGHDGGHRAAEANEHRHDGLAGKADLPEQLIHHERHAGHIAGVFENGQEEEQCHNDGQKAQNRAHALKNAVDQKAMYHRVQAVVCERSVHRRCKRVNAHGEHVAQKAADDVERQIEDEQHDAEEDRDGGKFAGENLVHLHAAQMLLAFARLDHGLRNQLFDEAVAHVGQRRVAVKSPLDLHLHNGVLDELELVLVELQAVGEQRIALDQARRGKARTHARHLRVVFNLVAHGMDAAVHRARRAEIIHRGQHTLLRHAHDLADELADAVARSRADRHHRDAQSLRKLFHVHRAAVAGQLIHHVERQHRGHAQRKHLQREIEVALEIRRVDDVDDRVGLFIDDEVARDDLLGRVRPQRIDARKVDHRAVLLSAYLARLAVDGDAREVADVLVCARQLVEKRRFAAVLVARQRKNHTASSSMSMLCASSLRSVRL